MRKFTLRALAGQLVILALLTPALANAQSTNITGYVLLAQDSIRAKRLTVIDGDLGVTSGLFSSRTSLDAPDSDVAAPTAKFAGKTSCDSLFANVSAGTGATCGNPAAFTNPFDDLAEACGYPEEFPACNAGSPVLVGKGQTVTLPPGVYGDVKVEGGAGGKGTLILSGITTICNLQVSREGKVLFDGPSTLNVTGVVTTSNAAEVGPRNGSTGADDINIFVQGTRFKASRKSKIGALVCAPNGRFSAGTSAELEGRFVAQSIRLKRNRIALAGMMPSTTTTSSTSTTVPPTTTTSTTIPASVCGNGVLEAGEECDTTQFGSTTCPGSSVIGAFLTCTGQCTVDFSGCPGNSTTTTTIPGSTTTTTIPGGSTTTTTIPDGTTTTTIPGGSTTTTIPGGSTTTTIPGGSTTTTIPDGSTTTTIPDGSTTTTVPSTTTTTTIPSVCGNGIVEPGEVCDGDIVCQGSATGSFLDCSIDCQMILEQGPCGTTTTTIPGGSTTTTIPDGSTTTTIPDGSTTTTVPSTTTTTTIPSVCGNGIVEPGEVCDGDIVCQGSATGSFLDCSTDCQSILEQGPCGSTTTTTIPDGSTTTTTSTTTSTTIPAVCGNGVVEPGEACDGDLVCEGSATGSFLDCSTDCQSIIDQGPCDGSTTTTTTPSSTSTTIPSTTSTTIPGGSVCGNGIVETGEACDDENTNACDGCAADCSATEGCGNGVLDPACGEVCDGQDFGDATCPGGSPGGALLNCSEDCSSIDTSSCQPLEVTEICGNCIDDNDNGLTDFEDPACCEGPQAFLTTLRKSNVKPRKNSKSFLRIKSTLATSGLMVKPMMEDVFLQIRDQSGTEVLCAMIPAGKMMMVGKKNTFKFWWDRKHKDRVPSAQNIDDMKVAIKKNGTIKYAAYGKHVNLLTPSPGSLMVTVGFRNPTVGDSSNRCSTVTQPYSAAKKGAIRFP
ncbi:MAG TPA: hypothetical protein VGR62_17925 [Candidatus Binatia bacterium]|jgi:cysteine-rich repeat protein|nr:hypothetical protein [Candidatus Binatia bacterium]